MFSFYDYKGFPVEWMNHMRNYMVFKQIVLSLSYNLLIYINLSQNDAKKPVFITNKSNQTLLLLL